LKENRERPSAYARAVRLLGARTHFRRELEAKLTARGYPAEEVDAALGRLAREGYLDDRRAAAELVASRLSRGALGRRRLAAELARRGADSAAAATALAELPDDDLAAARDAAARWVRGRGGSREAEEGGEPDPRRLAALARHLDRKGFSRRAIVTVLKDRGGEAGDLED
jgi:regulatory protein